MQPRDLPRHAPLKVGAKCKTSYARWLKMQLLARIEKFDTTYCMILDRGEQVPSYTDQAFAFNVAGACRLLGVSRSTLYPLMASGKLDARKLGGRTIVTAESLRAYVASLPKASLKGALK